ncbi:MAG: hypothetical protein AB4206_15955 [Xenococcaceae cyanobacterium]
MTHSQSDLEDRANRISEAIASIQKSIELLESSGALAPPGCSIVRYQARGNKKHYWYYKLQASEPIFPTKSGNMTRYKHLGASGTEAHIEALMQINRRNQLDANSRTLDSLMHCWSDLYENSKSENQS